MKNILFFVFAFCVSLCASQSLEEQIYLATERFLEETNAENLQTLNSEIETFEPQLKTEEEYFAFINLLINKAYYLNKNNQKKLAISNYEKAYQIYSTKKVYSYDIVEFCLIPLGILYHKTNAYLKAENIIKLYISIAKQYGNKTQQISGSINLAKLYQSLNKHESAISIVTQTLKIKGIETAQQRRLNSIKRRSALLLKTNQDKLYLDNDIVFKPGTNLETLELKYQNAKEKEDYKTAFKCFNLIKQRYKKNKLTSRRILAKLSFEEAQLFYLINKHDKALTKLNNTLAMLIPNFKNNQTLNETDLYPENTFIDVFDLLASIEQNPTKKLLNYELGFYVSSLLNNEDTNEESYFIKARAKRNRSEKCIAILHQLYKENKSPLILEKAINYAEFSKVSYLKHNSERKELIEKYGEKDTLLIKEKSLLAEQHLLTNRLLNGYSAKTSLIKQDSIRLRLIDLSTELKSIKKQIDTNYKIAGTENISLQDINLKLKESNLAIVEYFYGKQAIYQFVLSKDKYEFHKISIDTSTNEQLSDFINYFSDASKINNNVKAFADNAYSIYNYLNFEVLKTFDEVIIIPDGRLNFIPFESLLTEKTATTTFSEMPFLVKNKALAYNSSLLFYLKNNTDRKDENLLGVFPVFEGTDQELTYTMNEAESIEKIIPSKLLIHQSASKENFIKLAKDYSILHLSTHASSGDFFNPATLSFSDGDLMVNDLYTLSFKPQLVVLSACETGVGKLYKGEGVVSVARGFQYAGAENILFSLWQINDLSTSKIIAEYYNHYAKGESAIFANQQSKLSYLNTEDISNAKKSPYYWAALIFYGDLPQLEFTEQNNYLAIFSIIAAVLVLFLAFKIYRRYARRA